MNEGTIIRCRRAGCGKPLACVATNTGSVFIMCLQCGSTVSTIPKQEFINLLEKNMPPEGAKFLITFK